MYFTIEITEKQAAMIDAALGHEADEYATLKAYEISSAYTMLQNEINEQIAEQLPF